MPNQIDRPLAWTSSGRLKTSNQYPLYESKHTSGALDPLFHRRLTGAIINHGVITGAGFQVGEVITGATSGMKGTITAVTSGKITYTNIVNYAAGGGGTVGYPNNWTISEIITGGTSGTTAALTNCNTGAHYYYDYNTSSVRLSVGTLVGQRVVSQSSRTIPYFPNFEQSPTMTSVPSPKIGVDQYVMYANQYNGIGLYLNGLTPYVLLRTNTSGSVSDANKIPMSDWIDGNSIEFSNSQIQSMYLKWLGYGNVGIIFVIEGYEYLAYEFKFAGQVDDVYMRTASLSLRWEIVNTADTTSSTELREVCGMVQSEGGNAISGTEFSVDIPVRGASANQSSERTINSSTFVPLMAYRLKANYPDSKPNFKLAKLIDAVVGARSDDVSFRLYHVHGLISCNGAWSSRDEDSGVEYNTTLTSYTALHKHLIQAGTVYTAVGQAGGLKEVETSVLNYHSTISQNIESDNSELIVLEVVTRAGSSNITGHLSYLESE